MERDGGRPTGIASARNGLAGFNLDADGNQLRNYLGTALDPKLPVGSLDLHTVEGATRGPVLLVRVRKSFAAPHMVRFRNAFYIREGRRIVNSTRAVFARLSMSDICLADLISGRDAVPGAPMEVGQTYLQGLPDPVYFEAGAPYRFALRLGAYAQNVPCLARLRICASTDEGLSRSQEIELLLLYELYGVVVARD